MRLTSLPRLACALALLFAFGCSSSNKNQIEGTKWTSQAATVDGKAVPAGAMQLDFSQPGKIVLKRGAEIYNGTYSLGMGPAVTFHFEKDFAGRKIHAEKIVINGERLTMTDANGAQLTFQKTN